MRLDQFLAKCQVGSRSEVKQFIKKGKVEVNGTTVKKAEFQISLDEDKVSYLGEEYSYEPTVYYMLHKPQGVVSATKDNTCKTVIELLEEENRNDLFPIGRLDKDTEGLLLITNDGQLAHSLLSPKKHVPKTYYARITGLVTENEVKKFQEGIDILDEKPTLPAHLEIIKAGKTSEVKITIIEGRFHQVKRMFHALGMDVEYLQRISMGKLVLDPLLPIGNYKKITKKDILEGEDNAN